MESTTKRHIIPGLEYDKFFPKSRLEVHVIKRDAKLEDTIHFIPKGVEMTLYQTSKIAPELIGETPYETCRNVWNFCFDHIIYRKDEPGKEQIQSPQYTWAARAGDCDDYTVEIASILRNLKFVVILRVAMYDEDAGYQHIYPVAVLPDGRQVTMDCVAEKFDYEVPWIKKIDKKMELQFLNGIPDSLLNKKRSVDADDLMGDIDDIGELGKGKGKIKAAIQKASNKAKQSTSKFAQKTKGAGQKIKTKVKDAKVGQKLKTGFHKVNRVNPVTALLRTGILIAMKTNLFRIAEKLRFSYLSPQQADAKGLDTAKFPKLVGIRQRLEKIFYGAGGKPENLRAAIISGKGNRDKQVAGLGKIDFTDYSPTDTPSRILGYIYNAEISGVEGLGELGIATEAAIAAATGVLTAIAGLLKGLGDLRKAKQQNRANADTSPDSYRDGGDNSGGGGSDTSDSEDGSGDNSASGRSAAPGRNNSNQQDSEEENPSGQEESTDSGSDNRGMAENGSDNAETPVTASTPEGTDESQENSQGGNAEDGTSEDPSGSESSPETPTSVEGFGAVQQENMLTKTVAWVKAHPGETMLITLVFAGVVYSLVKVFSPEKEQPKHRGQLAGLPSGKKHKHQHHRHHHHHSQKLRFQKLR